MCFECGQQHCSECNVAATFGRIANCPTCRSLLGDPAEVDAERILRLAGRLPGRVAQYNLALMYEHGTGVPQDHAEAVRLYTTATKGTQWRSTTSG